MRCSATRQGLSQEARAPVDKCADYRLKNKHKQRFDHANGWPIVPAGFPGFLPAAAYAMISGEADLPQLLNRTR